MPFDQSVLRPESFVLWINQQSHEVKQFYARAVRHLEVFSEPVTEHEIRVVASALNDLRVLAIEGGFSDLAIVFGGGYDQYCRMVLRFWNPDGEVCL